MLGSSLLKAKWKVKHKVLTYHIRSVTKLGSSKHTYLSEERFLEMLRYTLEEALEEAELSRTSEGCEKLLKRFGLAERYLVDGAVSPDVLNYVETDKHLLDIADKAQAIDGRELQRVYAEDVRAKKRYTKNLISLRALIGSRRLFEKPRLGRRGLDSARIGYCTDLIIYASRVRREEAAAGGLRMI